MERYVSGGARRISEGLTRIAWVFVVFYIFACAAIGSWRDDRARGLAQKTQEARAALR
jgi:hypothetical protein